MIQNVFRGLGLIFFFLMLVIPSIFQIERGVLLAILVVGCAYKALVGEWKIHYSVLMIGVGCVTTSLIFVLYGMLNNAPGAIEVGTVYVLWPLIFMFFMGALNDPHDYPGYIKVIVVGVAV